MSILNTALAVEIALHLAGQASVAADKAVNVAVQRQPDTVAAGTGSKTELLDPMIYLGAKSIQISLGEQRAFLTEDGKVIKTYAISSGAPLTPTPQGMFQIHKKQELRVSSQAVHYRMPNYMAFTKNLAFGLHGLPYLGASAESSSYWQEAQDHIGIPVSHGCVRFLPQDAVEIYNWAEIGMPVYIQS